MGRASAVDVSGRSFDDWFVEAWPKAFRLAVFLTQDTRAGEDIAQDVLTEMSRRWESLDVPDAYMRRSVTNASLEIPGQRHHQKAAQAAQHLCFMNGLRRVRQ